jgi:hypothetical protein
MEKGQNGNGVVALEAAAAFVWLARAAGVARGGGMKQSSLFDTRPVALAQPEPTTVTEMQRGASAMTGRPIDVGDAHQEVRASSGHASDAERASSRPEANGVRRASGSEIPHYVLRILTHKSGDFTELKDGSKTDRTFRILQLRDGRYQRQWNDGSIDDAPFVTDSYVSEGLRNGMLVEVEHA